MYNSDTHIHFVGIGGVGMAGIAELLARMGYSVSGSDLKDNELVQNIRSQGVLVHLNHDCQNLPANTSVVVYSSAISANNVEIVEAKNRNIPTIRRAEMLAELMRMKYGVAVAGSHGKTTTTSLIAHILRSCDYDPSVAIGGRVQSSSSGASLGGGKFLVAEADESDGSFSLLKPCISVVTNLDSEHLSHYGSFDALTSAFEQFLLSLPFYGLAIVCADDQNAFSVSLVAKEHGKRVLLYGLGDEGAIRASQIEFAKLSSKFILKIDWRAVAPSKIGHTSEFSVEIPIAGRHMVSNTLAAIGVALEIGIEPEKIVESLKEYPGVARRCEVLVDSSHLLMIDDYAHHPKEISATLASVRAGFSKRLSEGRLIVVFQPHRYSRTEELFEEFCQCFGEADIVHILDIYPAGEKPIPGIDSSQLVTKLEHENPLHAEGFDRLAETLNLDLKENDILLTLGAGSIGSFARNFARQSL